MNAGNEAATGRSAESDPVAQGPSGADFIIPVLSIALVIYYSATTLGLAWEAKVTGVVIGGVLVPLCLVHMVRMVRAISGGHGTFGFGDLVSRTPFNVQRLGLVVLVAAFIASLEWVGTAVGLVLLLVACMFLMGVRSLRVLVAVPLITAAIVYVLLIYLLNSRLPQGPLEKLIGSVLAG